jgi:hypothetical protein
MLADSLDLRDYSLNISSRSINSTLTSARPKFPPSFPIIRTRVDIEITGHIGVGGIGEVYRARETNLKHDVAGKIPSEEFSRDDEKVFGLSSIQSQVRIYCRIRFSGKIRKEIVCVRRK